jgi:outer membrane protein assembly factor BamB
MTRSGAALLVGALVPVMAGLAGLQAQTSAQAGESWPQFRGPMAGVAADHPDLPERWSTTENVVWVADIPGMGWSSPVVWGDHVFVTSVVPDEPQDPPRPGFYLGDWPASPAVHRWMVYDLDARTGAVRWAREVQRGAPSHQKHLKNSYASQTPVTDGERVYASFGNVGLFVFDFEGQPVWSKPLGPFATRTNWGTGASPVLHGDRLYLVSDTDDQSFLAAYDKRTGAEVWRVDRDEGTNWSTPFVWEHDLRTEIVTNGSDRVRSYDTEGRLLWELTGMSTLTIPTPFARHGLLYICSGYLPDPNRPALAIRPGASGDISLAPGESSNAFIAWSLPTGAPYNPSPIVYGDIYYTLFDRGFFTSHDARTGAALYPRQRIAPDASGFTASPWAYNGRIFAMSEEGDTYVLQAGPEFAVLRTNSLSEMTLATPAVAQGSLIIRTASKLYRIAGKN